MTTQMVIRIDNDLKNKVARLAKSEGKNLSELIRDLMENYTKERDMGLYVDTLWDDIGAKIKSLDKNTTDIDSIIKEVRDANC